MWDKKSNKKTVFNSKFDFDYLCGHSSVYGRWDFEPYRNQDKKNGN